MVPPLFSATNSRRSEAVNPKVASRANSVSPTGVGSPPTRAQCTSPAVNRPASRNAGISSTPSNPRPRTSRRTASSAATSAMTCPRRVESLRLITSTGASRRRLSSNTVRPTRVLSATASASSMLRVLVRMKHVEPGPSRPAAISSGSNTVTTATSCTVCDPVGSSSNTTIRRPAPANASLIRRRASGSTRTGGSAARSTTGFVMRSLRCSRRPATRRPNPGPAQRRARRTARGCPRPRCPCRRCRTRCRGRPRRGPPGARW